jgi:biopolymer transport protein ExbD
MTWKVRHEGSPRSIEGLTKAQVVEGLQDGLWESTDEIMGPADRGWTALENHPEYAETVADLEPPPEKVEADESNLDMNPLIDVALVLLIFFILTTSYAALQKLLEMPAVSAERVEGKPKFVPQADIDRFTIKVTVRANPGGHSLILIEQETEPVEEKNLATALQKFRSDKGVGTLLINAEKGVEWGSFVAVQDAAKDAGFQNVMLQVPDPDAKPK